MTAVAPPLTFQPSSRLGWTSNAGSFGAMHSDEVSRMFQPVPRRTVQRQNSSSSVISSNSASSISTITTASALAPPSDTVTAGQDNISWATRKRPGRGLWPPGKAEPATGISITRPQIANSATNGTTASSAMSALHAPLLPSHQMANGSTQPNGLRNPTQNDPSAILHLLPINGTFERKTITIPYHPEVLRIGRQTNQKTIPTPLNGYFDSKVLSRQHAEVYADRQGRIFIRDVKSSNGTFVNGSRLSPENKESEPRELREQDVLELGIDIVSEDQKTVVHHKVAARIEHAGVYSHGNDALSFTELDLNAGGGPLLSGPHKRNSSFGSFTGRGIVTSVPSQSSNGSNMFNQPPLMRNWLNPITTEHIMKKLNAEMKLAIQQSDDLARARQSIEAILANHVDSPIKESRSGSGRSKPSPVKSSSDLKSIFPEPPAPPPSAPLPEKPDVARALADPMIQPLLRRAETVQVPSTNSSPTRSDHSSDILRLCEELKLAKGELTHQNERMKTLEHELASERIARESAEGRVQELEEAGRKDSPRDSFSDDVVVTQLEGEDTTNEPSEDLLQQFHWLHSSVAEMKQQMEAFRVRVEVAEAERDEARQSLAEMVEQKRKDDSELTRPLSPSRSRRASLKSSAHAADTKVSPALNGHLSRSPPSSPTSNSLLERAGVEEGQPITPEQAKELTQFLTRDVLHQNHQDKSSRAYYSVPITSAAAVILLGVVLMSWGNGWSKIER